MKIKIIIKDTVTWDFLRNNFCFHLTHNINQYLILQSIVSCFFNLLFLPNEAYDLLIDINSLNWKSLISNVLFALTYIKNYIKHELESFEFRKYDLFAPTRKKRYAS